MHRYLKKVCHTTDSISSWKSKALLNESIKTTTKSVNSLAPALNCFGNKNRVNFNEGCLKQDKTTFTPGNTVNIYISCEINLWNYVDSSDPTQGKSLFGVVKLVKNADIVKCKYSRYGFGFNTKKIFQFLVKLLRKD